MSLFRKSAFGAVGLLLLVLAGTFAAHKLEARRLERLLEGQGPLTFNSIRFTGQRRTLVVYNKTALAYFANLLRAGIKFGTHQPDRVRGPSYEITLLAEDGTAYRTYIDFYQARDGFEIMGPYDSDYHDYPYYEINFVSPLPDAWVQALNFLHAERETLKTATHFIE